MFPGEPGLMVRLPFCWGLFVNIVWSDQVNCLYLVTVFVLVATD